MSDADQFDPEKLRLTEDFYAQGEKARTTRQRKLDRQKLATSVFRDFVLCETKHALEHRLEGPLDFQALACVAVEAADALLNTLDDPVTADISEKLEVCDSCNTAGHWCDLVGGHKGAHCNGQWQTTWETYTGGKS